MADLVVETIHIDYLETFMRWQIHFLLDEEDVSIDIRDYQIVGLSIPPHLETVDI
jgi:hypothetical protein